ncbi:hypothetical protein HPB47_005469 [Ixodes persulcatus]|uniref:Uncharacterized protein n=1 Tax=Ixodes persulcatus TaxID=34615 RepID=A0AC60PCX0_IXOPE|nr:hypothetical protein HPB47_005469 [Ixodes persulcatus]
MSGVAKEFVWNDARARSAKTFAELRLILLGRFDTEPQTVRMQRFMSARQLPSEDVRSFATRVQMLARATVMDSDGSEEARSLIRQELLVEQMRSQFVAGLRDPVRRFVMSRDPKSFDEAVDVAAKEEANESLSNGVAGIRVVRESEGTDQTEMQQLKERLSNIERMLMEQTQMPSGGRRSGRSRGPLTCFACGRIGHIARHCGQQRAGEHCGGAEKSADELLAEGTGTARGCVTEEERVFLGELGGVSARRKARRWGRWETGRRSHCGQSGKNKRLERDAREWRGGPNQEKDLVGGLETTGD